MEPDAHIESSTNGPLFGDQLAEGVIVWIRNVFLESEGRSYEIDRNVHSLAKSEHDRRCCAGGKGGKFIDGKFAEVLASHFGGERLFLSCSVFGVALLNLFHGRPDVAKQSVELRFIESDASSSDAVANRFEDRVVDCRFHVVSSGLHCIRNLGNRQSRQKSGLTRGLLAMRMSLSRRNRLIAFIAKPME